MEWGAGPAVLLLHGWNGFKEGWGPLPEAVAAAGMRAVAVDLPGTGGTPPLAAGRGRPEAMAAAVAGLARRLAPAGLVGHSLGAQVAVSLAAHLHEEVRAVALLAPLALPRRRRLPPRGPGDLLPLPVVGPGLARLAIGRARRDAGRRRRAFLGAVAEPGMLASAPGMPELLDEAVARLAGADLGALVDWARAGLRRDLRPLARRVPQPALVVAGGRDRVAPPAGARALAAALPRGRLLSVPAVAHFPHLEAPGRVVPAVVAHLASGIMGA